MQVGIGLEAHHIFTEHQHHVLPDPGVPVHELLVPHHSRTNDRGLHAHRAEHFALEVDVVGFDVPRVEHRERISMHDKAIQRPGPTHVLTT